MFSGFYSALAGMMSFQRGLNSVSNNLANLSSPGFKGSSTQFRGLLGQGGSTVSNQTNFAQGPINSNSDPLTAAIDGNGFYILKDEQGQLHYTRGGQFDIVDNFLVDRNTGFNVMGFNETGGLTTISLRDHITRPPEATSQINFSGNIDVGAVDPFEASVTAFNGLGEEIALTFEFEPGDNRSYIVSVKDEDDGVLAQFAVEFDDAPGNVKDAFKNINITIAAEHNGNADSDLNLVINFGENSNDATGATVGSGATELSAAIEDGHATIGMTGTEFDADGNLVLKYSNDDETTPYTLALAHFNDTSILRSSDGALFSAADDQQATIGKAGTSLFGSIQGSALEQANVDMVGEFSEMLVIQRGYQSASQAMNVANEMIEQLYNR